MQKVFVLDTNKTPLTPCRPKRARVLLKQGKAAVFRMFPFTIILKYEIQDALPRPLRIKIDPGSKKTGVAIVSDSTGEVVFAAEIEHRGQVVKDSLDSRRAIRRGRRNRNTGKIFEPNKTERLVATFIGKQNIQYRDMG